MTSEKLCCTSVGRGETGPLRVTVNRPGRPEHCLHLDRSTPDISFEFLSRCDFLYIFENFIFKCKSIKRSLKNS